YFNVANYDEIYRYGHIGFGGTCADITSTGNTPPVVDAGPSGMVIPIQTPFELTASATDADGDALTYCWEQHDLGPAGNPNTPEGNAPIFRSFPPTSNPTRVFPRLQNLLNNNTVFGETYPTYTRDMSFRATVRDNNPAGGGLNYEEITMEVTDEAGPFLVNYPNDPEAFTGGDVLEVIWDPANTQLAPVDCDSVDIFLSVNGGINYQYLLKESTPNDGKARIILPDTTVGQIRFKVKAANNVFFDISNRNSSITASGRQDIVSFFEEDELAVCLGGDTALTLQTAGLGGVSGKVFGRATGVPNGIQVNLPGDSVAIGTSYPVNVAADAGLAPGSYTFRILLAGTGGVSELKTIEIQVLDNEAAVVKTIGDPRGEQFLSSLPGVAWEPLTGARSYTLQVATSPSFDAASLVLNISNYEATEYRFTNELAADDIYYWRVAANTVCGLTTFSLPAAFRIGDCITYSPQDLPQNIEDDSPNAVRSSINIGDPGSIADVNLLKIEGTHTAFNELVMSLSKVGGPAVQLIDQICTQREAEFSLSFDDESPEGDIDCLPEDGFSFRPAEDLSAFDGLTAAGEYELVVQDVQADDGGELQAWALQVCYTEPNAPIVVRNTPLEIKQFKSDFINQSLLRIISPGSAASDVLYVAVTTPRFGSLRLNGNRLGPGDTFTQADLDANSIEYFQNGTLVPADSFLFTVEVAGRSWLGLETFNIIIEDNTSTNLADELGLEVFPNPTRDEVTVRLGEGNEASQVAVYNLAGQRIAEAELGVGSTREITLSLGQHPVGLYLIKVQTGEKIFTKQIRLE
ncbi:MAG: cadherin-like domain-containing protein, partial [Bacteroidota bacterium]